MCLNIPRIARTKPKRIITHSEEFACVTSFSISNVIGGQIAFGKSNFDIVLWIIRLQMIARFGIGILQQFIQYFIAVNRVGCGRQNGDIIFIRRRYMDDRCKMHNSNKSCT